MSNAHLEPETQTDKAEFKIVPCTYPGCERPLKVNKFYAPHKGRCSEHTTTSTASIKLMTSVGVVGVPAAADAPPNRNLAGMRCPLCDSPLLLIRVHEVMGWPTLRCQRGECNTAIQVQPNWGCLLIDDIPEAWKEYAAAFNAVSKDEWGVLKSLEAKSHTITADEAKGEFANSETVGHFAPASPER